MEDEIRLCEVCQQTELKPSQGKYCGKKCYQKACNAINEARRKKVEKEGDKFPVWTCDNGHPNNLDFNPTKDKVKWTHFKCHCGKGTVII